MRVTLQFRLFLGMLLLLPGMALADDIADCSNVLGLSKNNSYQADPKEVQQCIMRGYDPPAAWRPNNGKSAGVHVSGARGFSYGMVPAPENSPGKVGASSSVNDDFMNFIKQFLNSSTNSGSSAGGRNFCPVSSDSTGLYGAVVPLGAGDKPLSCGGALSLTSYESSLSANADSLATTENGSYYIWLYQRSGNAFHGSGPNPVELPKHLYHRELDCSGGAGGDREGGGGGGGGCEYRCVPVDINPPVSQIITYNQSSVNEFMVHLISTKKGNPNSLPSSDPKTPEKYLRIPLDPATRLPVVPKEADCPLVEDYYREVDSVKADIVMYPAVNVSCEGVAAVANGTTPCTGAISNVTPNASCDTITLYPKGSPAGVVCDGKIQYAVLDRSTLIYPPGSTANFGTVDDHTGLLARSSPQTVLYAQLKAVFQLFPTAPAITINEGGILLMKDGSKLIMKAPATINPSANNAMLTGGAVLVNKGGSAIRAIPEQTLYSFPNPVIPLQLQLGRSVTLPEGYLLMTQPTPAVRLPIDTPPK